MNNPIKVSCFKALDAPKRQWRGITAAILLVLFAVPQLSANEQNQPDIAGQVTLVIGQAVAHNQKGEQHVLKRGDSVYVADRIETAAGGHVHLRFIDDGTVSLRPNSRLSIELYRYDRVHPNNSAIRFNLETGVIRSISGKATEAAHDRFRLNTPITAIGVLGTDFVVRAESEKMWAGVYSGAIAIAPLNAQCSANGLGACAGATHLSETMGSVMLEFSGGRIREKIIPRDREILPEANQSDGNGEKLSQSTTPSIQAESRTVSIDKGGKSDGASTATSGRMTVAEMKATDVATQLDMPKQNKQPPIVIPTPPASFTWARWGGQWTGDTMSQPYAEVRDAGKVTVGNKYFVLFSTPSALSELEPRSGAYDFKLSQGQVHFVSNGPDWQKDKTTLANLDAATLHIDFAQRQFATDLTMSNFKNESANLNISGAIRDNGIFTAKNAAGQVAGALSTEGEHAGMFFEREIQSGTFHGITDWIKH
ncbi:MAG: FecR domain-containing protein [Methylobacter sp.]|nr:FecR domain-containing protein [Methylobacter sp.]MDP2099522.1 FecR domain-containing protein [Methylobacter sp.]MDP2428666.1 FecR domain-containing protein [Methylobacter sp.]MDP3055141.1 FecR domain-containing protein [Methylobacter sp.]MDP3364212.1 FecR domain-containing protein [Methylobacter sp.]